MKVLAIDTSTEACSAALYVEGELIERYLVAPRKHIELLKPMVDEVMKEAEVDIKELTGLAFGAGPGSFAGLRVACAFMQGIGAALDLPIVPVSSLMAMAQQVLDTHPDRTVLVMLDAKMKEVYWGVYRLENKQVVTVLPEAVTPITDIPNFSGIVGLGNIIGAGNGWDVAPNWVEALSPELIEKNVYPRAGEVALLAIEDLENGMGLHADQISPSYLRNNIALTVEEQKAQRAQKDEK
ncbi:tRNA (adenosine(37)-N6)-threonylcarbamoyltransferase complex dimerization subunit type 1 TsaB [Wohlfahrtiimonas sp. G9077]|uniref:tRNA (adenosine(37)-N6)-threonylcarbamoyltransferase complex dimerization subunit type 1 TsaB n=1 Tax=Wohlfahrtiimonas sp. G9077 TaxID=1980118 RepID=UPI000B9917E8|nr:tRNA (adenosine(37)-N6)-threonylcarbamoyltransferase complex dimerization subunit type 1 TsaB [Wohlfahrtiimonas sp. G9077]OYQ73039.1 tRNA (adenosine(37)-N6)-threonylcarbamoyltransferase complex dimerization subunit type 1 TsaB [Wohlfahrtiimonas sp. G9077]